MASSVLSKPEFFDPSTGLITPQLEKTLIQAGWTFKQQKDRKASEVVRYLFETFFTQNPDYYKKGGDVSKEHRITLEKARGFLTAWDTLKNDILPNEKGINHGIIPCGNEPFKLTLQRRLESIRVSLESGCKYESLHFIVEDQNAQKKVAEILNSEENLKLLSGIEINYLVGETTEIALKNLKKINSNQNYAFIVDNCFHKIESIRDVAREIFEEVGARYVGFVSSADRNWVEDMKAHGYHEENANLPTVEKATLAWAYHNLHTLALKLGEEVEPWEMNRDAESGSETPKVESPSTLVSISVLSDSPEAPKVVSTLASPRVKVLASRLTTIRCMSLLGLGMITAFAANLMGTFPGKV